MKDITNKIDNDPGPNGVLPAAEFNQILDELKNDIQSAGTVLSESNLFQIATSMAIYAAGGDFYDDTGAVNAYVAAPVGSKKAPETYFDGMRVRFRAGNTNTGASTLNVNTIGVKSIKKIKWNC